MIVLVDNICSFAWTKKPCPYYKIGSASFYSFITAPWRVTKAHKYLISLLPKSEGENAEVVAHEKHPSSVKSRFLTSKRLPFICASPDLLGKVDRVLKVIEVKSHSSAKSIGVSLKRKKFVPSFGFYGDLWDQRWGNSLLFERDQTPNTTHSR